MFNRFTELFIFTKSERIGVIVLVIMILGVFGLNIGYKYFKTTKEFDYSLIEAQIDQIKADSAAAANAQVLDSVANAAKPGYLLNPNTASISELISIGLSEKQATVVVNYRSKGGRFYKPDDLLKIYSIDHAIFNKIKPFIKIPQRRKYETSTIDQHADRKETPVAKVIPILVDINTADTTALKKIRGIGSFYARNIVKYRSILGGYVSLEQLHEVYGLKDKPEVVEKITPFLLLTDNTHNRIDLNNCTRDELKKHPYIKWAIANSIVSLREQHGKFKNVEGVKKSALINEALFLKIKPYLTVADQ